MPTKKINGITMYYEIHGTGEALPGDLGDEWGDPEFC